jgi:hypothetical protein
LDNLIKENLALKDKENRLNELEIFALKFNDIEKMNENLINRFQEKNFECKELLQRIAILEEENSFFKKGNHPKKNMFDMKTKNFEYPIYSEKHNESISSSINDRENMDCSQDL